MTSPAGGPAFDPSKPHLARPRLRPIRAFMTQAENGQTIMGLADASQISDRMIYTSPAVQLVIPLLDGTKGIDEIVAGVGRGLTRAVLEQLIVQLDEAGLLFGPTFDAMLEKVRQDFDSAPVLPPASTAVFTDMLMAQVAGQSAARDAAERAKGEGKNEEAQMAAAQEAGQAAANAAMQSPTWTDEQIAGALAQQFDAWIAQALKDEAVPSLDTLPRAIVAPHLDYPRGWLNYAQAWGRLRVADRPDRVLILGTNHFGQATGICACDKGYQTAMGVCEVDADLLAALKANLGPDQAERLLRHRYDHEREHSVELQIPWLQHCLGKDEQGRYPRVLGVLIHDPTVNNGQSYDGTGLDLEPFLEAMTKALATLPGRTLIVCSADLSHIGPAFGDQVSPAQQDQQGEEMRQRVVAHDQEMLELIVQNKGEELVAAMAWQQNPTRWCSIGNIVAGLRLAKPEKVDLFKYVAAMDQQGTALVSSAALAMA